MCGSRDFRFFCACFLESFTVHGGNVCRKFALPHNDIARLQLASHGTQLAL